MLGQHLVLVTGRRGEHVMHDLLDDGQLPELHGAAALLDLDRDQWHLLLPSGARHRIGCGVHQVSGVVGAEAVLELLEGSATSLGAEAPHEPERAGVDAGTRRR